MAAGTESAVDTRVGKSKVVGNLLEKILVARQLAENERKFAEKKAAEAGTSLDEVGIEKGYFFKKALFGEFGGNYIDKKKKDLKNVVKKYKIAKRITKDPKKAFKFIKPLFTKKLDKSKIKTFRAKFDYTYEDENIKPQSPIVGSRTKKIQKALGPKKRITREDLLTSLTGIVDSLNKTAEGIQNSTAGMSSGIITAVQSQQSLIEQLKLNNSSLEDKLDQIVKAISNQTQIQKKTIQKAKVSKSEQSLETGVDVAQTETPDDTQTKENETLLSNITQNISPTTNIINNPILQTAPSRATGGYPSLSSIPKPGMDVPMYEKGGIVSGPNSGYLAKVPKGSVIEPIKNNYTEGKPSAVDGKVRPKPFEKGNVPSSVGGRFGFGITNMTGIAGGGTTQASQMTQPLVDAMSLPMMITGGAILSTVSKLTNSMGREGGDVSKEVDRLARPIADIFGLPPSIVNKFKTGKMGTGVQQQEQQTEGESKKDIIAKMTEGFGKLLEKLGKDINNRPTPPPPPGPGDSGQPIEGKVGEVISSNAKATYYDPSLGGINASGAKTAEGLPATSTGEGFVSSKFSAAAFPELLKNLPENMTTSSPGFRGGRTLARGQAFNVMITDKSGKSAIVRVNDVGPGVEGHASNHMLDLSPAAKDYFGANRSGGLKITMAPANATPGPITVEQANQITAQAPSLAASQQLTTTQLGQNITNNYGLKVGQERTFNHPEYGEIKAHKTDNGFVFFGPGFNNKLDMSPSNPQSKSIVDYFTQTNGGQVSPPQQVSFNPMPPSRSSVATAQIMKDNPTYNNGGGNIVAMLMPPTEQKQTSATVTPPLPETSTVSGNRNPLTGSGLYLQDSLA